MLANSFRKSFFAIALASTFTTGNALAAFNLSFTQLWSQKGQGSEIVAIDLSSNRVFNTYSEGIEIRDLGTGTLLGTYTVPDTGGINSVAVKNGVIAVAAQAIKKQDNGVIAFFNTTSASGSIPDKVVAVGAKPDMVTFTPDGSKVLVANEGEPDDTYTNDPNGTVSIVDLSSGIASASAIHLGFTSFSKSSIQNSGGRIFGPGATVSQDIEPEYVTVSPNGKTAFVSLQENNAVAKIDLSSNTIVEVQGLGVKDFSLAGNAFDSSNSDGINGNLKNWPVFGMFQPDSIDSYESGGLLYYVTANEGDARDYSGFSEEVRVRDLDLDLDNDDKVDAFSPLQNDNRLGRLKTTTVEGDIDGDGLYEEIYSYGTRSFSIRDENGQLIYDSGNLIENILARKFPDRWVDNRSDDKGPEPEALKIIKLNGQAYALLGLERTSGIMVFDITNPYSPTYINYVFNEVDISPEGLDFSLVYKNSKSDWGYVAVANEISRTTTLYKVSAVPVSPTYVLLGIGLVGLRIFVKS